MNDFSFLKRKIAEFFVFAIIVAVIFIAPLADILILKNGIAEISLTELLQELNLLIIAAIYFYLAAKHPDIRFGSILIAGFFSCLLIRELDFISDRSEMLSWFHFVVAVAGSCIYLALKNRKNAVYGLAHFSKSESYYIMVCGLVTVLVFSRLFGMKIIWQALMDDGYIRLVKNAAEEVTELFGYTVCMISAVKYCIYTNAFFRKNKFVHPNNPVNGKQPSIHS